MKNIRCVAAVTTSLLLAISLSAQDVAPPSNAIQLPKWDVDASIGAFMMSQQAIDNEQRAANPDRESYDDWTAPAYGVDAGRYWTPHLKFGVGFVERRHHNTVDSEPVAPAGLPNQPSILVFTNKTMTLATVSAAATYQFRENAFIHPYVSGGAQLAWLREHRFRDQRSGASPYPYTVLALDERNYQLLTRPFVAGGVKLYFSQRVFARPDALLTFGRGGFSNSTFRVAFGADF